jgi:hypothetical protein
LSTPLMVWLARAVYDRRPAGPDGSTPALLVQLARTGSAAEVRRHLLRQFVPAVYAGSRWEPRAAGWLAFLAAHLADPRHRADGIAWWRLGRAAPGPVRLLVGASTGLLVLLALAPGFSRVFDAPGIGVGIGSGVGLIAGVLFGRSELPPTDVELQVRQRIRAGLRGGLATAVLAGSIVGAATREPVTGALVGLAFGVLLAFGYMHTAGADTGRAVSPRSLLHRDRTFAGTYLLLYGVSAGLAGGLVYGPGFGVLLGVSAGLVGGLTNGIGYAFSFGFDKVGAVAWYRFQVARAWLAATGKLPWRLLAFLAEARQLGVLRQEGGTYHFRHAELREQLARSRRGG